MLNNKVKIIWFSAIFIHLLTAWFSTGYFHVDEHFQLIEYTNYLLGNINANDLAWEFKATMRPTFQVFIFYGLVKFFGFFGLNNPFILAAFSRVLSASLGLLAIHFIGKIVFKENKQHYLLFVLISCFLWFMPYQHVRFSSENWSAIAMAFTIVFLLKDKYALAGVFSALSFAFRFQAAFFIVGIVLWLIFIRKNNWKYCIQYVLYGLLVFGFSIIGDYLFYGKWVVSSYIYFYQNLIVGKAAEFGTEPFYYYFIKIIEQGIAPFGILLLITFGYALYKFPKHLFLWTITPFILGHFAIGHKELRFLFPLIYFLPVFFVWFYVQFKTKIKQTIALKYLLIALLVINFIALPIASFKSSNPRIDMLRWLYSTKNKPIVCLKQNPYLDNLWYQFYMKDTAFKHLQILENTDSLKKGMYLIVPYYKLENSQGFTKIYSQVPSILESTNQIQWLERSNFWSVYRKD